MSEDDYEIVEQLKRIADALEKLVNEKSGIPMGIKDNTISTEKHRGIKSSISGDGSKFTNETLEISEEVLMDLTEVTVIFKTDKSVLVTKKGFQKWVAFSLMDGLTKDNFEVSNYCDDIPIREDKKVWFNEKKSWAKLEVAKK